MSFQKPVLLVTLVVPPLRQAVRWGGKKDSDRQDRKRKKKKVETTVQDTESRGVVFLCGYIFKREKSMYGLQTLRYTILNSTTERHEELDWLGSSFPGISYLKAWPRWSVQNSFCFWLPFQGKSIWIFTNEFASRFPYVEQLSEGWSRRLWLSADVPQPCWGASYYRGPL